MYRKQKGQNPSRAGLILKFASLALILGSCQSQTPVPLSSTPSSTSNSEPVARPTLSVETPTPVLVPSPQTQTPVPTALTLPVPLVGVESNDVEPIMLDQFNEIGVRVVRRNALLWSQVESVEGERNWRAGVKLEEDLQLLGSYGFQTILIVRSTPDWAQKVLGYSCGQVKREDFAAFARFLQDAVARYSVQPYNVKYWEIWNEPDVDPSLVPPGSVFGCWGDQADEYYGGGYYAHMLKQVYPAIKEADPQAQVLIGGLLLDCDPTHPPEGKDCKPSRFLEGILREGGANYFDIVSFHGYPAYIGTLEMDERIPAWAARGGIVMGKVNFIREVLGSYGVEKPLMHTESALICPGWRPDLCNPPGSEFYEAQADYAVILYVRNQAAGIAGTIWYTFEGPGWLYSGLLDEKGAPKPAYRALKFLSRELGGAQYSGPVNDYPSVRGFSFSAPDKRIWLLWSPDPQAYSILLPEGVQQVFDKYGNPISLQDNSLEVMSPVYVELEP